MTLIAKSIIYRLRVNYKQLSSTKHNSLYTLNLLLWKVMFGVNKVMFMLNSPQQQIRTSGLFLVRGGAPLTAAQHECLQGGDQCQDIRNQKIKTHLISEISHLITPNTALDTSKESTKQLHAFLFFLFQNVTLSF